MLINTKNINIDGIEFQIHMMGSLKAAGLDRKILAIILPSISGIATNGDKGLDTEISIADLLNNLSSGLLKLSDEEYQNLLTGMFSKVIAIVPGKSPVQLDSENAIDEVFSGKLLTIYKLVVEVMKHNGFSVFGLMGGGFSIDKINMFDIGKAESARPAQV